MIDFKYFSFFSRFYQEFSFGGVSEEDHDFMTVLNDILSDLLIHDPFDDITYEAYKNMCADYLDEKKLNPLSTGANLISEQTVILK